MGSRKSTSESLAALNRAYDAGIRWFDVAPSYGDGAAEETLGAFVRDRRPEGITIATKVGILPGRVSLAKSIIKPAVRMALSLAPGLRGAVKRSRPAAMKQPLTPDLIAASIVESQRRLGTDRLDAVLLHDATPEEVADPAILRAVEDLLASGKAARVGIASSPAAVARGLAASPIYTMAQFANNPVLPGLTDVHDLLTTRPDVTVVTHSVLGSDGMVEAMTVKAQGDADISGALKAAGYDGASRDAVCAFLTDYALAGERATIVLMSMFSPRHLANNVARRDYPRDRERLLHIAAMFQAS